MNNIKHISIKEYLSARGVEPQKEHSAYGIYLSPLRRECTPSFKVDYNKNLWYDFGLGEGGSIIDLVMQLDHCDFGAAVAKLKDYAPSFSSHSVPPPVRPAIAVVSVCEINDHRLVDYFVRKRAVDINVAKEYCREVRYKIGKREFVAIGFSSDKGGWELRNEYFKGSTSPKSPTTIGSGSQTCLLFEGFMYMLSYLTMHKLDRLDVDMVVLNSVNNLAKAAEFLKSHQTIHCFLDNDEAGKRAVAEVEKLGVETIDYSAGYHGHKDLNEYLINQRQQEAKPRQRFRL